MDARTVPLGSGRKRRSDQRKIVGERDAQVVAAAIAALAPFLFTLDVPLEARVNGAGFAIRALSPGIFIKKVPPKRSIIRRLTSQTCSNVG